MPQEKIDKNELFCEIEHLLKDEFIAKIQNDGKQITLTFTNGQKFMLTLTEIQ